MWSFNGDGTRSFQIYHILAKKEELKGFTNCDINAGVESNLTAVAAIIIIAKFIPRKQRESPSQSEAQGDQTKNERNKKASVDWEAIRLDRESANEFNEQLDGLSNE
jgi:hypothetical protein